LPKKKDRPKRVVAARISDDAWKFFEVFAQEDDRDITYWISRFIDGFVAEKLKAAGYDDGAISKILSGAAPAPQLPAQSEKNVIRGGWLSAEQSPKHQRVSKKAGGGQKQ
jgi:hypothetical protein